MIAMNSELVMEQNPDKLKKRTIMGLAFSQSSKLSSMGCKSQI